MTTTNLSVYSANFNSATGIMTCLVTSASPLYIYELIIEAVVNLGAPTGVIRPGKANQPALRTIFVDSSNPVFSATAPFTLAVTYDASYQLSDVQLVRALRSEPLRSEPLPELTGEKAIIFVKQVVEAAVELFTPAARTTPEVMSPYAEGTRGRVNGKDKYPTDSLA